MDNFIILIIGILAILISTFGAYLYIKKKISNYDFNLANKIRPIFHILLFISIVLSLIIISLILALLGSLLNINDGVLMTIGLVPIFIIIYISFTFPFLNWNDSPVEGTSYALYLRSFRSDRLFDKRIMEQLKSAIKCIYPIYTIGNPNEAFCIFKSINPIYKTNEQWQKSVLLLKKNAKIIFLKIDGTEGFLWEVNNLGTDLYKSIFVAINKESFKQFYTQITTLDNAIYKSFPNPSSFPALIWLSNNKWTSLVEEVYIKGVYEIRYERNEEFIWQYLIEHPWQKESVDNVLNLITYDKDLNKFRISKNKTLIHGNVEISKKIPQWIRWLFLLFPYSQKFYKNLDSGQLFSKNPGYISLLLQIYIINCPILHVFSLFSIASSIVHHNQLTFDDFSFLYWMIILSLPIRLVSFYHGPEAYWLTRSFLNKTTFKKEIIKNSIIWFVLFDFSIFILYIIYS